LREGTLATGPAGDVARKRVPLSSPRYTFWTMAAGV
jgi:hypothetical protein